MIKVLIKKQLYEIFRGYFYDSKKNKARSVVSTVLFILLFVGLMAGVLGGIFTYLSISLCAGFVAVDMGWLFFLIMALIAIAIGAFGSIFNTYSGLYLSKDNDLLLSMPIPVSSILAARLITVYLMGLMYSAIVIVPAVIVYWIFAGATVLNVIGGLLLVLLISLIVLILSCALGWCVAKISLKLKHKNFTTVIASLLFLAAYYWIYFKAQTVINDLMENAIAYGNKVKDSAYVFYLFGKIGEGDPLAMLTFAIGIGAVCVLTCYILARSFIGIVTSSGPSVHIAYKEKKAKQRGEFAAVLGKEFSRFTSSANYMLNCGLGSLFFVVIGVLLLIKRGAILPAMTELFGAESGSMICIFLVVAACATISMNDMVVPSVSLEGKSLWILQSVPVDAWNVIKAKLGVQLIVTAVPLCIYDICMLIIMRKNPAQMILAVIVPVLFLFFMDMFGLMLGIVRPNLTWTNELAPIKQSLNVMIAMLGGWAFTIVMVAPYLMVGYQIGAAGYLLIVGAVLVVLDVLLYFWLKKVGVKKFAELGQ